MENFYMLCVKINDLAKILFIMTKLNAIYMNYIHFHNHL